MSRIPWGWLAGSYEGLFHSYDGIVWERVGAYPFRVTSIVREGQRVWVGVGSGAWEVPSPSDRWVQVHDETLTEVLDLARVPGDPGLVAGSAYGVAVGSRNADGSVRWRWCSDELPVNERFANAIAVDPGDHHRWVVGTEAGLLVAEEDGRRWTHSGLMGTPVRAVCYAMATWWAGTDAHGVWRSSDALFWSRAGHGLDDGTVFALTESGSLMLSTTTRGVAVGDGEGRWDQVGPQTSVADVAVHPDDPSWWVAGAVPGGIWVTYDMGRTWRSVSGVPTMVEAIAAPFKGN